MCVSRELADSAKHLNEPLTSWSLVLGAAAMGRHTLDTSAHYADNQGEPVSWQLLQQRIPDFGAACSHANVLVIGPS